MVMVLGSLFADDPALPALLLQQSASHAKIFCSAGKMPVILQAYALATRQCGLKCVMHARQSEAERVFVLMEVKKES